MKVKLPGLSFGLDPEQLLEIEAARKALGLFTIDDLLDDVRAKARADGRDELSRLAWGSTINVFGHSPIVARYDEDEAEEYLCGLERKALERLRAALMGLAFRDSPSQPPA